MKIKILPIVSVICILLFSISCSKEEKVKEDEHFTEEEIESINESAQLNLSETSFEGTYSGTIKNKETELILLEDFKFKMTQGSKVVEGDWERLDDGTTIELVPNRGSVNPKYYAWTDESSWIALNNEREYGDEEEILEKVK